MAKYSVDLYPQEIKTISKILRNALNPRELQDIVENLSRMEQLDVRYASERFLLALDDLDESPSQDFNQD